MEITNPLMIYTGGKWNLAHWIISHFPPHRCYVEPFGGGGAVLLQKPRSKAEVYNDLNDRVANVFKVLRSNRAEELMDSLRLTPYSRYELIGASKSSRDPVEDARRTIIRAHMSRGRAEVDHKGFRYSTKSNRTVEKTWASWVGRTQQYVDRLMGVLIENRDAMGLIPDFDSEETLFYVDPPYPAEARKTGKRKLYANDMVKIEDHEKLLTLLVKLEGMVVVSGYDCELYNDVLSEWTRSTKEAWTTAHSNATEVLWCNKRAGVQLNLF